MTAKPQEAREQNQKLDFKFVYMEIWNLSSRFYKCTEKCPVCSNNLCLRNEANNKQAIFHDQGFWNIYLNFFFKNFTIVEIQLPWFPPPEERTLSHSILKWIFHVETCLAVTLTALKITTKGLFTLSPVSGHCWPTAYFPAKNQFLHGNSYIKWHIIFHVTWNEIHAIIELFSKL